MSCLDQGVVTGMEYANPKFNENNNTMNNNNIHHQNIHDNDNHYDVNHPRSAKRRCSVQANDDNNHSNNGDAAASSGMDFWSVSTNNQRDCYTEVTQGGSGPASVQHDWFYEIPSIRRHDYRGKLPDLAKNGEIQMLVTELQTVERQLQQVKRRFGTAADRCAEAVCQSNTFVSDANIEFEHARRACNPYEVLGETRRGGLNNGLFLNRSAIKLANIDAILGMSLTTTMAAPNNNSEPPTFYFADLCAAPGGFSEYILRRFCNNVSKVLTNVSCRGFGMSLVGHNDQGAGTPWKLLSGPLLMGYEPESNGVSVSYHICHGRDGTGDVFQWHNVEALRNDIMANQCAISMPHPTGKVPLVLADGGVDAQRNSEHQEEQTQKLVLCQVAAALGLLQPGGRLVLKLLSCQSTPMLQAIMQDLYESFDTLQLLKPISSRPASAERYLVCTGFQPSLQHYNNNGSSFFAGPQWINRMLLGNKAIAPELRHFLAQFDRDMMQLNLKACFAILSSLESKTMRLTAAATATNANPIGMMGMHMMNREALQQQHGYYGGTSSEGDDQEMEDSDHNDYQMGTTNTVDIEEYKVAWGLF